MSGSLDPSAILSEFHAVSQAAYPVLTALGYAVGMYFLVSAGREMFSPTDARDSVDKQKVVADLAFGSIFVQIGRIIAEARSLMDDGGQVRAALAYVMPQSGTGFFGLVLTVVMAWVALIGAIGVFRGFLLWRDMASGASRQGGTDLFWRGLWHIIGGGIAMNL